jgi:hypothetical protein
MMSRILLSAFVLIFCFAGTYRPVLDENDAFKKGNSEKDIDGCLTAADKHLASHSKTRTKKAVGRGAGLGAAFGALGGALSGSPTGIVKGAGRGAAGGAGSSAIMETSRDNLTPDQMKQNYVKNCLEKKGYKILGWE